MTADWGPQNGPTGLKETGSKDAPAPVILPCPWCGSQPTIEPWHGGGPHKHAVHCDSEDCKAGPMVTGETRSKAIAAWDRRAPTDRAAIVEGDRSAEHYAREIVEAAAAYETAPRAGRGLLWEAYKEAAIVNGARVAKAFLRALIPAERDRGRDEKG